MTQLGLKPAASRAPCRKSRLRQRRSGWVKQTVVRQSQRSEQYDQSVVSSVKRLIPCHLATSTWEEGGGGCSQRLLGGHGTSGDPVFYHLGVTVTVRLWVDAWGRQGGGQRVGMGGDVVFIIVVRLGRPLGVTAGEEIGARPGHSRFLFWAGAAHLLPGNHRNNRSAASVCSYCICVNVGSKPSQR